MKHFRQTKLPKFRLSAENFVHRKISSIRYLGTPSSRYCFLAITMKNVGKLSTSVYVNTSTSIGLHIFMSNPIFGLSFELLSGLLKMRLKVSTKLLRISFGIEAQVCSSFDHSTVRKKAKFWRNR